MTDEAFDAVLRLVSEGRLTAEEAGPILDALDTTSGPSRDPRPAGAADAPPSDGPGRAIRVEITEGGRKVVNLRVPLALGRAALARVPGLSESTNERIREAIEAGIRGPIVAVDEGAGDGVRIVIE